MPENDEGHWCRACKGRWIADGGEGEVIIDVQRWESAGVIVLDSMWSSEHKSVGTISVIKI